MIVETKRLSIKPPTLDDFDDLLTLRTDPDVMKYIGDGSIQSKEKLQEVLPKLIAYYKKFGTTFFSVFEKKSGRFVGQAGIFHLGFDEAQSEYEIAYRLHKKYWALGYATELAKALIEWGFKNLPINHLTAVIKPENEKSRHVLEKSGMYYLEKTTAYNQDVSKYQIDKNVR